MKTVNQLASLIILLLGTSTIAADSLKTIHLKNACSFHGASANFGGGVRSFASDSEAQLIANRILRKYDMTLNDARFQLRSALGNRIANATAGIENGQRFILYRQSFIQKVNRAAGTPWAGTAIMAHEIAHHLLGHTLGNDGSRIGEELKADRWAGAALKKLGASQNEATAVFRALPNIRASATHPGREERIDAVINGWLSVNTNNPKKEFIRQPRVPEPEMVAIRGGRFMMGSPANEAGRDDDERAHQVSVGDFSIGKHEVTVGEFRRFVDSAGYRTDAEKNADGKQGCFAYNGKEWAYTPGRSWKNSGFTQNDQHPVTCVSQRDAFAYANWLSNETGSSYNLPTEAQWEYAARAGTTTARYWGNSPDQACSSANVADQSTKRVTGWNDNWTTHSCNDNQTYTSPVGRYTANRWGLMDMMGNVLEWTCSAYDKNYGGSESQCTTTNDARNRVLRGGSWGSRPAWVRSADRDWSNAAFRLNYTGFRLSRTP